MFESPDLYMDDLLGILAIEKIRYDHTGFIAGESLYGDDFPVVCYDALGNVADSISCLLYTSSRFVRCIRIC